MKNLILSISVIIIFTSISYSQEVKEKISFEKKEVATVVSGNLVKISDELESSEVIINKETIEIINEESTIVLSEVNHIGNVKVNDLEIIRYKCENSLGEPIIFSVSDKAVSIFNLETNFVVTLINS